MNNSPQTVSILDREGMRRALTRIAHEILERNGGTEGLVLVGVRTRGRPIAQRIADLIKQFEGTDVPVTELDVTPYRDDRRGQGPGVRDQGSVGGQVAGLEVEGRKIILVDDVFFTG